MRSIFKRRIPRAVLIVAVVAAVLQPAPPAAAFEKAFWGPTRTPDGRSAFPIYEKLGVTLYQIMLRWDRVADTPPAHALDPNDPAYQWPEEVSYALREARKHDMKVLIMIMGAPDWEAVPGGDDAWHHAPRARPYARFAYAASRRYPSVRHWMVWGEPTTTGNFQYGSYDRQKPGEPLDKAQKAVIHRYARVLDATYGQLKRANRKNIVIGGNTVSYSSIRAWSWARNLRVHGRPARMDFYGHNPFSARSPDFTRPPSPDGGADFSDLRRFGRHVQRYLGRPRHRRIPLFLSEWNAPTGPNREFNYYVSEKTQARWIRRAFRLARGEPGIAGLGWIILYDGAPTPGPERPIRTGLIRYDGTLKPGFRAFMRG
jgi:hypothetical protein